MVSKTSVNALFRRAVKLYQFTMPIGINQIQELKYPLRKNLNDNSNKNQTQLHVKSYVCTIMLFLVYLMFRLLLGVIKVKIVLKRYDVQTQKLL
jgi:hypothetical protein